MKIALFSYDVFMGCRETGSNELPLQFNEPVLRETLHTVKYGKPPKLFVRRYVLTREQFEGNRIYQEVTE